MSPPTMSRQQLIDHLVENGPMNPLAATRTVEVLEELDVLTAFGPPRTWLCVIDDPSALQKYEYEIEAHSASAALREAAKRAIVDDPNATMGRRKGQIELTKEYRRSLAEANPDLVKGVARFGLATEVETRG